MGYLKSSVQVLYFFIYQPFRALICLKNVFGRHAIIIQHFGMLIYFFC